MKKRLKINGVIIFLGFLSVVIFPSVFFRHTCLSVDFWDEVAEIFGITFILLGQIFRVSARGFKAEHSEEGKALVQTGPYGLVRNPMYLGIFLIGLGVVLMLFKWWVLAIFLVVFIIWYIPLMRMEEAKLTQLFPGTYTAYCKEVRHRFIPALEDIFNKDISDYLSLRWVWIKKEIGSILALLLVTFLAESWQDITTEGIFSYLHELTGMFIVVVFFIGILFYLNKKTKALSHDSNKG